MGDDAPRRARLAEQNRAVAEREDRLIVEKTRRADMRAGVERAHVRASEDVGSFTPPAPALSGSAKSGAWTALPGGRTAAHAAQARKPLRISSSFRSRPMNTTLESRFSSGRHSRCGSPSSIM